MIRPATHADIPWVLEMGRDFAVEAGVVEHIGWDDDTVEGLLEALIDTDGGILLVGEKAMIGGMVYVHPYSGNKVFQELFWRSHGGGEGVKLLKAAEATARDMGATHSIMIGMSDLPDLAGLYGRMGYAPIEQLYCKEL